MNLKWLRVFVILTGSVACADRMPTGTRNPLDASFSMHRQARSERAALLRNVPVSAGSFSGWLTITRIAYDASSGQLLFSGIITRSSDGATADFNDVPGALSRTERRGTTTAQAIARPAQAAPADQGPCNLLFFSIRPLHLDTLGLTLDLDLIAISVNAVPGPGNLLGNLLCTVTGLLDNGLPTPAAIESQLERINTILSTT